MKILSKKFSEDEFKQLQRDLNNARAKVYRDWGFSTPEIAKLLDIPESEVEMPLWEALEKRDYKVFTKRNEDLTKLSPEEVKKNIDIFYDLCIKANLDEFKRLAEQED